MIAGLAAALVAVGGGAVLPGMRAVERTATADAPYGGPFPWPGAGPSPSQPKLARFSQNSSTSRSPSTSRPGASSGSLR
ncbi:hypothetical protein [Streptomyces sp. NPDC018947]|uniref:hypothetical protein n=1 Tax=Streptomyces sp. NPDC018947 TaxID=3365054 RepID=UPI0037A2847A